MAPETDSLFPSSQGGESSLPLGLTLLSGAIAAAVVFPLVWILANALEVGGTTAFNLLTRETTVRVFVNSTLLVAVVTAATIAFAVPLAYLTVRTDLPFKRFWTVALSMPLVVPSYIGAFAFVSAFGPRGELQSLLAPLGIEQLPEIYGFTGAALVMTLYTYPYVFISTRASLKTMDARLVDAARTLKHSRWEAFRRVTIPQIRPAVTAGALLVALYTLSDFGTPAIMRFDVFTKVIYAEQNSLSTFGQDLAALLSLQLVIVTFVILAIESRVRGSDTISTQGTSTRGAEVRLGAWKWPALALCLGVAGLALIVPVGILTAWLIRGGSESAAASLAFQWEYAFNSVGVSAVAALVAGLAGLPIAYLAVRHRSRASWLIERASYVGYAVPGVVMGLALVYFGARYGGRLYQQELILFPLLIFAYVVRFLPQAVGSTRAGFLQVSPTLSDAARTLGRSPVAAFREVTLPLVAPGLLGGALLVFLTTMKELPATLLLRPTGFKTLVTHIWSAQASGHFGHAAIPALVLVVVSALSMLVMLAMEGYDVK
ncbi:ABC transporter permease [Haladaptatus sp. ZSTT2]|uniref:ABC transporter permease n=1 Tax=Haladaptatus sp. ZSTT2 TaxID=3120515 RepID=UPI00300ED422